MQMFDIERNENVQNEPYMGQGSSIIRAKNNFLIRIEVKERERERERQREGERESAREREGEKDEGNF